MAVPDADPSRALALYDWNLTISESFYIPLHFFEICLRNRLANALSRDFGVDWFLNPQIGLFPDTREELSAAIRKSETIVPTVGQIIAELSLGFWVSLLGPRYDAFLWRRSLYKVFRSSGPRARKQVHGRINALRRLRNRIAHHEPVFDRPLDRDYYELIEAISWMCPTTASKAGSMSRIPDILPSRPEIIG